MVCPQYLVMTASISADVTPAGMVMVHVRACPGLNGPTAFVTTFS